MRQQTTVQRDALFDEQRDLTTRQPGDRLVGAYRDGRLVGGMRVYDFTMCVRGAQVPTGGIGSVAVGFEHKQRGVARDLVAGFLAECGERGSALAALYPFRPDFYRKLGFGYGTKLDQYRIALTALPGGGSRERVRRLGAADVDDFAAVYARVQERTNGLMRRESWRSAQRLANETLLTFAYDDGTALRGYLTVEMRLGKTGSTNRNELVVVEFVYETPAAMAGLLAFARSQSDQFAALVINTQDRDLHVVFDDPRNGSDRSLYPPVCHETNAQGLGIMYRVVDTAQLARVLETCRFAELDATLRIDLTDAMVNANAGPHLVTFAGGRLRPAEPGTPADVDVAIDVADFSSLVMGSVALRSLVAYGRAVVSDSRWLARLDAAFATEPPHCLTRF